MFGAYQAGAWKALAAVVRPDVVIGASAGALNGWAIAGGCAPDDLIAHWLDPSCAALMRFRAPWLPWRGCFDPAALEQTARELTARFRPQVEFAAVLAEVPRLRPYIVRGEEVTWRHLLASAAVPLGFPPVRIGGRTFVDGGLLGVLPLWAAPALGADRVVAIDALPVMPSRLVRGAVRVALRIARANQRNAPAGLEVFKVSPGESLGTLREAIRWDRENALRWIERGQRDAERLLEYCLCRTFGSTG